MIDQVDFSSDFKSLFCLSRKMFYQSSRCFFVLNVLMLFVCCGQNSDTYKKQNSEKDVKSHISTKQIEFSLLNDTVFRVPWKSSFVEVIFRHSVLAHPNGVIVLLPGWNFSSDEWCTKMDFCQKASAAGFDLIMPQMLKSIYAMEYYPETRFDLTSSPTRRWLNDTLIPFFQLKFGLLKEGKNNFICGISTGGRGAMLLAMDHPEIFTKGVALSGDFNPLSMQNDHLLKIYYGSYNKFRQRWKNSDNAYLRINELKIPFYILHGDADGVVNSNQATEFYRLADSMKIKGVKIKVVKGAGHNYKFWNDQCDEIISFFQKD